MKRRFRIVELVLACLVTGYFFAACEEHHLINGKDMSFKAGKPLKGDIHIGAYNMADETLTLYDDANQDAVYARVTRNQPIKWLIDNTDDMKDFEIVGIKEDRSFPNAPDFFSQVPANNGNHWAAQVHDEGHLDPAKGFLEKYVITWRIKGRPKTYTCDPIMQLNPR